MAKKNNNIKANDSELDNIIISEEKIANFFNDNLSISDSRKLWKNYGGYLFVYVILRFFSSPRKKKPKIDLNLIDSVSLLLQTGEYDKETIERCGYFINLHRHLENTSARKRLERWAKIVISIYLLLVFFILIINGGILSDYGINLFITDNVMIIILSTTTINIIGIGLIVLRGHFNIPKKMRENEPNIEEKIEE